MAVFSFAHRLFQLHHCFNHLAIYAGFPAAMNALKALRAVEEELAILKPKT